MELFHSFYPRMCSNDQERDQREATPCDEKSENLVLGTTVITENSLEYGFLWECLSGTFIPNCAISWTWTTVLFVFFFVGRSTCVFTVVASNICKYRACRMIHPKEMLIHCHRDCLLARQHTLRKKGKDEAANVLGKKQNVEETGMCELKRQREKERGGGG